MSVDLEGLKRLARAATKGDWTTWCDHQSGLKWLCNDKDHACVGTLGPDGALDRVIARFRVDRSPEEEASLAIEPADKAQVVADASFIAAANPAAVLALIERVEMAEARVAALEQFASQFSATVESDFANEEAWNKGGMRPATLTGDFVRLPPSAKGRLRWWAERAKEALNAGKEAK